MARKERYRVIELLTWGGVRGLSKQEVVDDPGLILKAVWDTKLLNAKRGEIFTVEYICEVRHDDCCASYIYEIETANDKIIGSIEEDDYFRNETVMYEFLGYSDDEDEVIL